MTSICGIQECHFSLTAIRQFGQVQFHFICRGTLCLASPPSCIHGKVFPRHCLGWSNPYDMHGRPCYWHWWCHVTLGIEPKTHHRKWLFKCGFRGLIMAPTAIYFQTPELALYAAHWVIICFYVHLCIGCGWVCCCIITCYAHRYLSRYRLHLGCIYIDSILNYLIALLPSSLLIVSTLYT